MKCRTCENSSEGFAVAPGIGDTGEIRFYCDACARRERVKMRYWDGRDLEVGGWREDPDLGDHYHTLIFSFQDLGRMRRDDLVTLLEWVEDDVLAAAMVGADTSLQAKIFQALPRTRADCVRMSLRRKHAANETEQARRRIAELVRKL